MKPHILYIVGGEVRERHGPYDVRSYTVDSDHGRMTCTCGRAHCRHMRAVDAQRDRDRTRPTLLSLLAQPR
jgi:hypothetical protein